MMKPATLNMMDTAAARSARSALGVQLAGVVGFALLTALAAQVRIPLPTTPVPITLQTLVVLLAGVTLGPWLGLTSMVFYVLMGVAGYHVFALTPDTTLEAWGLAYLLGPTGGYLLGFVLAQPALGLLTRPARPMQPMRTTLGVFRGGRWLRLLGALLAGHATIFACGVVWLALWANQSANDALALGFTPFVPGLAIKTLIALAAGGWLCQRLRRVFDRAL